jgi:hypothetical protein
VRAPMWWPKNGAEYFMESTRLTAADPTVGRTERISRAGLDLRRLPRVPSCWRALSAVERGQRGRRFLFPTKWVRHPASGYGEPISHTS